MPIQKHVLNNKVILITEPIATVKTVAIGFWFPVGSRYEKLGSRGISHFVEHMLFKGTSKYSAFDIACAFDRIGGYVNAFTERDVTCLYATVPSDYYAYALDIMCAMITDSLFLKKDITRERKVIESEIVSAQDDPEEAAFDELYAAIWPNQLLSQSIAGSVADVRQLTRNGIFNWYKELYSRGNLTVTVSGNIESERIREQLESLPPRPGGNALLCESIPLWKSGQMNIKAAFQQNQIFAAFPVVCPISEEISDYWAILNAIIGDTMSSHLFQRLREKNGYCYNVYSFFTSFQDASFWCAYAAVSKRNTAKAIAELQDEFALLIEKGVTEEEVAAAKEHIRGEEIIASEDVESRMKRLARLHFASFPLCTYEEYIERIQHIPTDLLCSQIRKVFCAENESLVVYGGKYDFAGTK